MGVFKKLTGADVRVTPIRVKYNKTESGADIVGTAPANFASFGHSSDTAAHYYKSIKQLYYGAFFEQDSAGTSDSIFENGTIGSEGTTTPSGVFSRYDPSFQGSGLYNRDLGSSIKIKSISKNDFGYSIVPGTVSASGVSDDLMGNLGSGSNLVGNVFYDQGIIVRTDGGTLGTVEYQGSYTIYATQYKCTADPHEFNYTLNPTALADSSNYDTDLISSPEFMPYVTTIGLYNENQELMMVAKLSKPVRLNPYTSTNFIVRLDR